MRILLTHHSPLRQSPTGWLVWQWAVGLSAHGHQVRLLIADDEHRFGEPLAVDRVVCGNDPNADLVFGLPRFSTQVDASDRPAFASLSDADLALYRDCLRRRLDTQVLHFDPHVIHAQHVWILGQLALESGVPYVLNAWDAELVEYEQDVRYRPLAEQAAENASRILVADEATRRRVETLFEFPAERAVLMPDEWNQRGPDTSAADLAATAAGLHALYEAVLAERFG